MWAFGQPDGQRRSFYGKIFLTFEISIRWLICFSSTESLTLVYLVTLKLSKAIISNLEEKCNLILESKVELDSQLKLLNEQLDDEKEINADLAVKKSRALGDCVNLKNEISDLELTIAKVEKEKHVMEIRIQNLKEEMVNYEATVQRITSEKKSLQELQDSTLDDLQAESDKNTTINRLKTKESFLIYALYSRSDWPVENRPM